MKSTPQGSLQHRQVLLAAALAALVTAGTAIAQSGGAGSTSYGSSQKNPPADTGTTATTGSASSQDTKQRDRSTTTDTTRSSSGTYGTGATSTETTTTAGAATGRETRTTSERLSWGDRRFVTKAADSGMEDVQVAKLAAEKANNPEVRNFAQKLVEAHSSVNSELTSLAGQKNVNLDTDEDKPRAYNRLTKKSGAEFDQEFVEHMIDEHEKDIKMFEKAAKDAKDADVRSFASKHVSHLREHLQTAQHLQQSIMPTGRSDEATTRTSGTRYDSTTTGASATTDRTGSATSGITPSTTDTTRDATRTYGTGTSTTDTTRGSTGTYDTGTSTSGTTRSATTTTDTTPSSSGTTGTGPRSTDTTTTAGAPTGREPRMTSDRLSWGDRRFVTKAADSSMDEIELARLAAQKATNPEVRRFAQKLVEAHGVVNSELTSLAGQKNVKLDTDDDKTRAYKRLNKKSGSEFDQEFVEHMIDEHEKDVKMFEKAAKDAKDAEIRSFASKHVSHLREHLQTAQRLQQSIMPTGRPGEDTTRAPGTTYDSTTSGSRGTQDSTTDRRGTYDSTRPGTTGTPADTSTPTTPKRDRDR